MIKRVGVDPDLHSPTLSHRHALRNALRVMVKGRLQLDQNLSDGRLHSFKLEKVEPWEEVDPEALCLAMRSACPPEDLGGPGTLKSLLERWERFQQEEESPSFRRLRDWLPPESNPSYFLVEEVNDEKRLAMGGNGNSPSLSSRA